LAGWPAASPGGHQNPLRVLLQQSEYVVYATYMFPSLHV